MAEYLKQQYRTIMEDNFPDTLSITFGHGERSQTLVYRKKTWRIPDKKGDLVKKGLRYGENPGQEAALYELVNGNLILGGCEYIQPGNGLVSAITTEDLLQAGKHPGMINLTDVDAALNILKYFSDSTASVIIKHNNPCGVALAEPLLGVAQASSIANAYQRANLADRLAAFGGVASFNRPVDMETAEMLASNYLEVVAAPEYEEGTLDVLARRKNLRVIRIPGMADLGRYQFMRHVSFKSLIDGGLILQQSPLITIHSTDDFKLAEAVRKKTGEKFRIEREPTQKELEDMLFGWRVEQGVTSNSVIYVKDGVTVGIGTGEQDRVGVAEQAVMKAYTKMRDRLCFERTGLPYNVLVLGIEQNKFMTKRDFRLFQMIDDPKQVREEVEDETYEANGGLRGAIMVSDAFFPFRDGVDVGIKEGITGIVQPGGSERDFESIIACNEADPKVTMVFTGQRCFRH
ncbi:IMP cyclohydrolase [Candidatus Woesearchaeota archaeon]|nr:MAG: IMP cyclohydrolase [Candidatus Woesearchaeota archaeon]